MYFKDHNPPHFHADYGEFTGQFNIETLLMMEGNLPKRVRNLVMEWADEHRDELMKNWEAVSHGEPFSKIKPLE